MSLSVTVNGATHPVEAGDQTPLADYLRDTLKLKGTRLGCGEEMCGACVVLVDGQPRHACQLELGHLAGSAVVTVEALEGSPTGRRLLDSFEQHQAAQCGFCTSGILMRAHALLAACTAGTPCTRDGVVRALEPHLCRCGAHPRMIAAVQSAAAGA